MPRGNQRRRRNGDAKAGFRQIQRQRVAAGVGRGRTRTVKRQQPLM